MYRILPHKRTGRYKCNVMQKPLRKSREDKRNEIDPCSLSNENVIFYLHPILLGSNFISGDSTSRIMLKIEA